MGTTVRQEILSLDENDKCLCFAPHPDDESIGCGGTIALNPDKFKVICFTDGSRAGSDLSKDELIKTRKAEFLKAMDIAKVKDYSVCEIPDKKLAINSYKCENIDISGYDYIFIPNILDNHKDHKAVSAILNRLLSTQKRIIKKDLKIAFYEVWLTLPLPNFYSNISAVIETKRAMINAHDSQVKHINYTDKSINLNSFRGLIHGFEYAEAFEIVDVSEFNKRFKKIVF